MSWLTTITGADAVARAVLILALVVAAGLALGSVRIRGVGLGSAGVLFAGIVLGHLGLAIDRTILEFVREFGLILFVFTIGLQLGPGFFAALRRQGLQLNLLAAAIVALGSLSAFLAAQLLGLDPFATLGLLAGATTNTPSLAAAQQALATLPGVTGQQVARVALSYAAAYPVAIGGIIGSLVALRSFFRIDPVQEAERFRAGQQRGVETLVRMNLVVENPNLDGLTLGGVPGRRETGVVVSRIRRAGEPEVHIATEATILHPGDVILAVGTAASLEQFRRIVGRRADVDLIREPGNVTSRRIIVTRKAVVGKSLKELGLAPLYEVTVTRVTRADLEMTAVQDLRLQFGDVLQAVGSAEGLERTAVALGNSLRALGETHFAPIFLGVALGVLLGVRPFALPGVPVPVRLGLAGGPLLVAILVGRLGRVGPLLWYMPLESNLAFREMGISLFLACVGLRAGEQFFATVLTSTGMLWLTAGLAITVLPLLAVGTFARALLRLDFMTLAGLLAGSVTDPPALAFAGSLAQSEAPALAYAAVYPLTMLLRILIAQVLAITMVG
jgi:putative transport protein